jgi:L-rhamnose isomerase/sugar isomerase
MVDQSHNLKPKIEAMIQTVVTAQELYAKAALVDRRQLRSLQKKCDVVGAENLLKDAYATDVRDALASWRKKKKLAEDPLAAFKKSGYAERAAEERTARRKKLGIVQGGSYA